MKLTKSQLKEMIKEELLNENSAIKLFMNKPQDTANDSMIRLVLDRKIDGNTAWYRLETDGWFRKYWNPGKGYGIMLREIKIKTKPIWKNSGVTGPRAHYQFTCKYLPIRFDDTRDDVKENWEHSYGFIIMDKNVWEEFDSEFETAFLESYIKNHINKGTYTP